MGDYDDYSYDSFSTNPSTGLPIYDDSGIDVGGNPLGMSSYDSYSAVDTSTAKYDCSKNNDDIYHSMDNGLENDSDVENYNADNYPNNINHNHYDDNEYSTIDFIFDGYLTSAVIFILLIILIVML